MTTVHEKLFWQGTKSAGINVFGSNHFVIFEPPLRNTYFVNVFRTLIAAAIRKKCISFGHHF